MREKIIEKLVEFGAGEKWEFMPYHTKDLNHWLSLLTVKEKKTGRFKGWIVGKNGYYKREFILAEIKFTLKIGQEAILKVLKNQSTL